MSAKPTFAEKGRTVNATDRDLSHHEERNVRIPIDEYTFKPVVGRPHATVGHSYMQGTSTQFGKEKVEVCTWVTLPCEPTPEGIREAHQAAQYLVTEYHADTWDLLEAEFFPDHEEKRQRENAAGKH